MASSSSSLAQPTPAPLTENVEVRCESPASSDCEVGNVEVWEVEDATIISQCDPPLRTPLHEEYVGEIARTLVLLPPPIYRILLHEYQEYIKNTRGASFACVSFEDYQRIKLAGQGRFVVVSGSNESPIHASYKDYTAYTLQKEACLPQSLYLHLMTEYRDYIRELGLDQLSPEDEGYFQFSFHDFQLVKLAGEVPFILMHITQNRQGSRKLVRAMLTKIPRLHDAIHLDCFWEGTQVVNIPLNRALLCAFLGITYHLKWSKHYFLWAERRELLLCVALEWMNLLKEGFPYDTFFTTASITITVPEVLLFLIRLWDWPHCNMHVIHHTAKIERKQHQLYRALFQARCALALRHGSDVVKVPPSIETFADQASRNLPPRWRIVRKRVEKLDQRTVRKRVKKSA